MSDGLTLSHEFVEFIPKELKEGTVYVSIPFKTSVHLCCCGCGRKVVTRLSPRHWNLTFDGETISLRPSIGNWSFPCESHYWITNNSIEWSGKWTQKQIEDGRAREDRADEEYFASVKPSAPEVVEQPSVVEEPAPESEPTKGIWGKFTNWVRSRFRA